MMQKLTHFVWGVLLSIVLKLDSVPVVLGALLPDLDYRFEHRKLLHNVFAIALVSLISGQYWLPMLVGMVSHIVLDMMTVSGVALLYPLSDKRFRIASFRTGGLFDHLLLAVGSLLVLLLLYQGGVSPDLGEVLERVLRVALGQVV